MGPRRMPLGRKVWLGLLALGGAVELYGVLTKDNDDTLSELVAWAFDIPDPVGRGVFLTLWTAFAGWFAWHIWTYKRKAD